MKKIEKVKQLLRLYDEPADRKDLKVNAELIYTKVLTEDEKKKASLEEFTKWFILTGLKILAKEIPHYMQMTHKQLDLNIKELKRSNDWRASDAFDILQKCRSESMDNAIEFRLKMSKKYNINIGGG